MDAYVEVRIDCSVFFPAVYSFVKFKGYPQILTQELANLGATLAGVLETHFHADFVSGHLELQERFNVPIYFGPGAGSRAKFPLHEVQDGEVWLMAVVFLSLISEIKCIVRTLHVGNFPVHSLLLQSPSHPRTHP